MTFTINKEYSKSTIKTPRNSAKTRSKLTKTPKRHDRHSCGRVDVPLIFKNVRKNKKVYSEKIPDADSAPRNRS